MGQVAFVFSGQGAQYSGMGAKLAAENEAAAAVFRTLDALRPGTSQQCFSGTAEELRQTENTQPCLFAVELAAAAALTAGGLHPDRTAGFSLGELSALTFSGGASLETGFSLVCRRGELMGRAAQAVETGMAAVLKLEDAQVETLCARFPGVYPVNYNCPGQVAVAGKKEALAAFSQAVKEAGGRALPLKVAGGFHSPFMTEAAEAFGTFLGTVSLSRPGIPLYSDYTGDLYEEDLKNLLEQQINHPVRWQTIIRNMIAAGVDTFVEVGPGSTLCGLIRKIDPAVRTFAVEDPESLEKALKEAKPC